MSQTKNQRELKAWLEWKKWCSIFRVYDPQPVKEELAEGKCDDLPHEERCKLYDILRDRIYSSIKDKLWYLFKEDSAPDSTESKYENDDTEEEEDVLDVYQKDPLAPFISCFDNFMKGKKKKEEENFIKSDSGRRYKDYIFYLAHNSKDSPLKTIRGKITSANTGYILEVIKKFHIENHVAADTAPKSEVGIKVLKDVVSIHEPINENDPQSLTYGDLLSVEDSLVSSDEITAICANFTKVEKLLILATSAGLSLNTPELNRLAGLQKTALYTHYTKLFSPNGKLCEILKDFSGSDKAMNTALSEIKSQIIISLKAEKNADAFLKLIESMEAKQKKEEAEHE